VTKKEKLEDVAQALKDSVKKQERKCRDKGRKPPAEPKGHRGTSAPTSLRQAQPYHGAKKLYLAS